MDNSLRMLHEWRDIYENSTKEINTQSLNKKKPHKGAFNMNC